MSASSFITVPMKLLSIFGLASLAAAQIVPQGTTLSLDGVNYFIPPFSDGKLDPALLESAGLPSASGFAPITIVSEPTSPDVLGSLFSNWTSDDDVWQPSFTGAVVLANASDCETLHTSYYAGIQSSVFGLKDTLAIPTGPYFINIFSGEVHQAYRLYEDFAGAFLEPLIQQPDGKFQTLSAHVQSSSSLTIGVPSRLYFTRTAEKPLAGVRVGVKDLYDLAGVKSSRGNRAWYGLYPPSNVTAPAIQNLIDAGAVIVGTQKLSQFANGENPTADWVDYHAPFNPRGDGYQNPSSSSSGAGASVASYEWLDVAVGSDTGGSIRGPAGVSGIFGNRPTHGLVSLDNVMPMSPTMDTAGFLTRDPYLWQALQAAMYGENFTVFADTAPSYPTSIYVVGFPANDTPTGEILNNFANDLASMIQASLTTYDMDEQWAATGPAEVAGLELNDFLNTTYPALITKEQIPLVREPFYADYAGEYMLIPVTAVDAREFDLTDNPQPLMMAACRSSIPLHETDGAGRTHSPTPSSTTRGEIRPCSWTGSTRKFYLRLTTLSCAPPASYFTRSVPAALAGATSTSTLPGCHSAGLSAGCPSLATPRTASSRSARSRRSVISRITRNIFP